MTSPTTTVSAAHWETLKEQYRSRQARALRTRQVVESIHDGTFGTAAAAADSAQ
jgi:hypothetical protein